MKREKKTIFIWQYARGAGGVQCCVGRVKRVVYKLNASIIVRMGCASPQIEAVKLEYVIVTGRRWRLDFENGVYTVHLPSNIPLPYFPSDL